MKAGHVELTLCPTFTGAPSSGPSELEVVAMSIPFVAYSAPWKRALLSRMLFPVPVCDCAPGFDPLPPATKTSMREFDVQLAVLHAPLTTSAHMLEFLIRSVPDK